MRILFVLEHFYPNIGGVERLFLNLCRGLVEQGHEVEVVTTWHDPSLPKEEEMDGIHVLRIRCNNRYFFTLMAYRSVRKAVRRADVVHTTSYNAAIPAFFGAFRSGKPVLITFHEVWAGLWFRLPFMPWPARLLHWAFEQLVLRLPFRRFVAVSDFGYRALRKAGVSEGRLGRVWNGLAPVAPCDAQKDDVFRIGFFGRLGISKGIDVIIPAAMKFLKENPGSEFVLVLPGRPRGLRKKVDRLLRKHGPVEGLRRYTEVSDRELRMLMCSCSCIAMPSYSEGFGFVAVEAAALGIPLVHSGKGALQETAAGKHICVGNLEVSAWYEALTQAAQGQFQYREVRTFPLEQMVEGYLNEYHKVLSESK